MTTKEKVKIRVSTHDFDTKEIDVSLNGTMLNINIGADKNQVDLSSLIPPRKDFRVVNGTFNPVTKAINLVVSNNTEEDTVTIDLQGLLNIIPTIQGEAGTDGTNGKDGKDGKSAYEVAVQNGFIGTPVEWLKSLKGEKGDKGDAFTYADFTPAQLAQLKGAKGDKGADGKSSYDLWRKQGNEGTEQDFLKSLKGTDGRDGRDGQLDCGAIASLPLASWKKGTSILASQDGECKRLVPNENFFQEVGVTMTANKLSGLTGETYHIVATVTNSGSAPNTLTDLVLVKPQLGNYRLSNFTTSASSGARVEKVNDLTYKLHNLGSGGVAKVEFDVVANANGTFQFGANINPNTGLDQQSNNNQATITLSVNTPVDTNYLVTADCPLITATYENTPLWVTSEESRGTQTTNNGNRSNIFWDTSSFAGKSIKLIGAKSVIVCASDRTSFEECYISTDNSRMVASGAVFTEVHPNKLDPVQTKTAVISTYTFDPASGILTFGAECTAKGYLVLFSGGVGCKWQYVKLVSTVDLNIPVNTLTVSGLDASRYTKRNILEGTRTNNSAPLNLNNIGGKETNGAYGVRSKQEFVHIKLKKGQSYNFTITSSKAGKLVGADQKGELTISLSNNNSVATVVATPRADERNNIELTDVFRITFED